MKKILSVVLAIAMLFCFAACGSEEAVAEDVPAYSTNLTKEGKFDLVMSDYVTLPEYKGVQFDESFWTVTDEDVEEQLDTLLSNYATSEQVTNRAIEFGDSVNIDYVGTVDGVEFDGGTATGQTVTAGGTNYIDDFLTQIIGHFPGDSFDVEVTFPDPYENDETLSGKDAVFAVTINYISESITPELTDDFVKENFEEEYGLKTVDELREYEETVILETTRTNLIDEYLTSNSVISSVPDVVYDNQVAALKQNFEYNASNYGIDTETLLSYYGFESMDDFISESEESIISMASDVMIYQAIAEAENIEVKNTEVADYFEEMTGSRDYSDYQTAYGLPYLKLVVMVDKVCDIIIENAVQ